LHATSLMVARLSDLLQQAIEVRRHAGFGQIAGPGLPDCWRWLLFSLREPPPASRFDPHAVVGADWGRIVFGAVRPGRARSVAKGIGGASALIETPGFLAAVPFIRARYRRTRSRRRPQASSPIHTSAPICAAGDRLADTERRRCALRQLGEPPFYDLPTYWKGCRLTPEGAIFSEVGDSEMHLCPSRAF
jgi:hypothetical protein